LADLDAVNQFFAAISSTITEYCKSSVLCFKQSVSETRDINEQYVTAVEVEVLLRRVKKKLQLVLTIYHLGFSGTVPTSWLE